VKNLKFPAQDKLREESLVGIPIQKRTVNIFKLLTILLICYITVTVQAIFIIYKFIVVIIKLLKIRRKSHD